MQVQSDFENRLPLIGAKVIVTSTEEETEKQNQCCNKRRTISCTKKGNDKRYEAHRKCHS
jgi:hypothetical protein